MAVFSNMMSFNPNPRTAQEAIEQCVIVNRLLANEGILDTYGHVSVRSPENLNTLFQPRRMAPGLATWKDITELNLDGNAVSNKQFQHLTETLVHSEIYKVRPNVNAICHNHAKELIPFSSTGTPLRPIPQTAGMFYKGIPVFHNPTVNSGLLVNIREVCQKLAQVSGDCRAASVGVYGVVVIGENAINSTTGRTVLRDNAVPQLQAMQLGSPRYPTEKEGRVATETMLSPEDGERMWSYWLNQAKNTLIDLCQ